jgi:hypothetical protein
MARSFGGELDHEQVGHVVDRQYEATIEGAELRSDCLDSLRGLRERGCTSRLSRTSTTSNSEDSSGVWGWRTRSTRARARNRRGRASQILASTSVRLRRLAARPLRCFSSVTVQRTTSVALSRCEC